jgi:hypothetical protein
MCHENDPVGENVDIQFSYQAGLHASDNGGGDNFIGFGLALLDQQDRSWDTRCLQTSEIKRRRRSRSGAVRMVFLRSWRRSMLYATTSHA